jgi:hypothetical protein
VHLSSWPIGKVMWQTFPYHQAVGRAARAL